MARLSTDLKNATHILVPHPHKKNPRPPHVLELESVEKKMVHYFSKYIYDSNFHFIFPYGLLYEIAGVNFCLQPHFDEIFRQIVPGHV